MKPIIALAFLCALLAGCSTAKTSPPPAPKTTFSSFDQPDEVQSDTRYGAGEINLKGARVAEFLVMYRETSGRTVICPSTLPQPTITLYNQSQVTRTEVLQLFDTALAQNGIAMVLSGENAVKAVPIAVAAQEAGPVIDLPSDRLPDSGSYMVRIVHLKKTKPSELVPMIQPFAKVPKGIIAMEQEKILVLRDFSSNIRQMLKVIEEVEKGAAR